MSLVARIASLAQRDAITTVGIALSAVWLLLIALFWFLTPGGGDTADALTRLVAVVGVVLPLALIWLAVLLGRSIAMLKAEAADLRHRLAQLREATTGNVSSTPEPTLPARTPADRPLATNTPRMAAAALRGRQPDNRQSALHLETPEAEKADPDTLIRAMNFPDGPDDVDAILALRRALTDHADARALRAAQDVVTLLAAQDVYMDDLSATPTPPALWRRFAEGERGAAMAALGAIHDEAALEITRDLLDRDEIFRDSAHHFLRHFDSSASRLIPALDDAQIGLLAQTRSARAFALLGRLAGTFG